MERPRILVVEDDPCGRELLALIFEREDYDVIEVANGAEALSMVGRDKIDLIFLDLSLPTMIGDEVVRRIKADPRTARIPVIVNTAFDSDTEIVKYAIAAGADQILYKPPDFKDLLTAARKFVSRGRRPEDQFSTG